MNITNITLERVEELREWLLRKRYDFEGSPQGEIANDLLAILDEKAEQLKAGGGEKISGATNDASRLSEAPSPGPSDITTEQMLERLDRIFWTSGDQPFVTAISDRLADYARLEATLTAELKRSESYARDAERLTKNWRARDLAAEKAEADYNEAMKEWREDILRLGKAEVDMGRLRAEVKRLAEQLKMCRLDEIGAEEALETAEAELAAARPLLEAAMKLEKLTDEWASEAWIGVEELKKAALAYRRAKEKK